MSTFANLDEAMAAGAARAVDLGARHGVALDYSVESIRIVEEQLAGLHDAIPKGFFARLKSKAPPDADIRLMEMTFGAYVGEVLKRHLGGHWSEENSMQPDVKLPTLHLPGGARSGRRSRSGNVFATDRKTTSGTTHRCSSPSQIRRNELQVPMTGHRVSGMVVVLNSLALAASLFLGLAFALGH